ncbi:uncharacterized protein LOC144101519 [Amblyomma americanum]
MAEHLSPSAAEEVPPTEATEAKVYASSMPTEVVVLTVRPKLPSTSATTTTRRPVPSATTKRTSARYTAETDPGVPTTSTVVPERTVESTVSSTLATTSTRPPFPSQPPMKQFPMVCIFGVATNESVVTPADGVCDFTFYDGLYANPEDTLTSPSFRPAVDHVVGNALNHSITQYGLSFDFSKRREVARHLVTAAGRSKVVDLWKRNLRHYGFLSINSIGFNATEFREAIEVLASLHILLQMQRTSPQDASYLAVGFYAQDSDLREAMMIFRKVFTPDLIVAHGHIGFDDRVFETDCRMVLPTPFSAVGKYKSSQLSALAMLEGINHYTAALAVSVALFGRRYRPAHPDPEGSSEYGGFLPGKECTSYAGDYLVHYTYFCKERIFLRNLKMDIYDFGVSSFDKKEKWTIVYDTEYSIAEKLCLGKQAHTDLMYGVAAYGLEYADHSNECPSLSTSGAYGRTRLMKTLVRFFETGPSGDRMRDCNTTTPDDKRGDTGPYQGKRFRL